MTWMTQGHRPQARVLVADWDPNYALSLTSVMHRAGFETAVAFNGKEAVEKAQTFGPDVFATEAYVGRMSGFHAAERIKAACLHCKLIFLWSDTSGAEVARQAAGADVQLLVKTNHPSDLLNTISSLLWAEAHWGLPPGRWSRNRIIARDTPARGTRGVAADRMLVDGAGSALL